MACNTFKACPVCPRLDFFVKVSYWVISHADGIAGDLPRQIDICLILKRLGIYNLIWVHIFLCFYILLNLAGIHFILFLFNLLSLPQAFWSPLFVLFVSVCALLCFFVVLIISWQTGWSTVPGLGGNKEHEICICWRLPNSREGFRG